MGIVTRLLSGGEKRYSLSDMDEAMDLGAGFYPPSATGVKVTQSRALQMSAVYACVRVIAETVASLPLPVYRRLEPRGKERDRNHPLYKVLHDEPNPEMTAMTYREVSTAHLNTWGNCYSYIEYDQHGNVSELWPLRPDCMKVKRENNELTYKYTMKAGQPFVFQPYRIFHIPGLGYDGIIGYSPIHMAREAIGLGLATEEYAARWYSNDGRPGGVIEHPEALKKPARENIKKSWREAHSGLDQAHKVAILEEGMKFHDLGIPQKDAQFLESRAFQVLEIARFYRMQPHKIQSLEHATFSNIEHMALEFATDTLRPWLVRWEQAIEMQLFSPADKKTHFAEHLIDGLLRGDIQSRYQAYATARQNGFINADEMREKENWNPIPDGSGKIYWAPLNMVSAKTLMDESDEEDRAVAEVRSEFRGKRSVRGRLAVRKSYVSIIEENAARCMRGIKRNVLKGMEGKPSDLALKWLDDYTHGEGLEWISSQLRGVLVSLAEGIYPLAVEECNGADLDMTDIIAECMDSHVEALAFRESRAIFNSLNEILQGWSLRSEIPEPAIELLDEIIREAPARIAAREMVRIDGLITKAVTVESGIPKLTWVNTGDDNPFCLSLDGESVDLDGTCKGSPFLHRGQLYEVSHERRSVSMEPSWNVVTPPLKTGCTCTVKPG